MLSLRSVRRQRAAGGLVLALVAGQACGQVDRFWATDQDGEFGVGSNWSPAGTPTPQDNVFIAAEGDPYEVTLDAIYIVQDFSLLWSGATLQIQSNGLGASRNFTLTDGTVTGFNEGGSVLVGGRSDLTSAVMRDFGTYGSVGDVVATDMLFENIESIDIGVNGSLTLRGENTFTNVDMLNVDGELVIDTGGGLRSTFDDTCVSNGRLATWTGAGTIGLSNGAEIMNPNGSTFNSVGGDGDQMLEGDGETTTFDNEGMFKKGAPEGRGGGSRTIISGVIFTNEGIVQVESGELDFATRIVNDNNQLDKGEWNVLNSSVLTLRDQSVEALTGGAKVMLSGQGATFEALDALRAIGAGSELGLDEGKTFDTDVRFANNGKLFVGEGSAFLAQQNGLSNLANGILVGGEFEIEGLLVAREQDEALLLNAKLALVGEESEFAAIDSVEIVGSVGEFAVRGGREFATAGDFFVVEGGRVIVGEGSMLDVTGQLNNYNDGVFDAAFFEVAGTLRAPGLAVGTISNELILDGVGSQFLDENNQDALAVLSYIAPDGILRLRNGRTLDNIDNLVVDGILEIDPGPGGLPGDTRGAGWQLSVLGHVTFNPGSELIIGVDGTGEAEFGTLSAGGLVMLGGEDPTGGLLRVNVDPGYLAQRGDEIVFIRASGVLGRFEGLEGLDLGGGLFFEVVYGADFVSLVVVPSPAGVGLLALAGITAGARRRR